MIDWEKVARDAFGDLSRKLLQMGYGPERLEYLILKTPWFSKEYQQYFRQMNEAIEAMSREPGEYGNLSALHDAKEGLLRFANHKRGEFLRDAAKAS